MDGKLSRRDLIKSAAVGASGIALGQVAGLDKLNDVAAPATTDSAAESASNAAIVPLTSTSDVFVPPHGGGFLKFSFDFPEPSLEFEELLFSFRLFTFENAYGPDPILMTATKEADGIRIHSGGVTWAGGQQKAHGKIEAQLRRTGGSVEWTASAEMDVPIKSIASIVRGVPRGKISAGGGAFFDPKDEEQLFGYPFGGGSLFTANGMDSPIVVIQLGEREFFFLSAAL